MIFFMPFILIGMKRLHRGERRAKTASLCYFCVIHYSILKFSTDSVENSVDRLLCYRQMTGLTGAFVRSSKFCTLHPVHD